jgi:hypothetical protein
MGIACRKVGRGIAGALLMLCLASGGYPADAGDLFARAGAEWGGYAKLRGRITWADARSHYGLVGAGVYRDFSGQFRLNHHRSLTDTAFFNVHYELTASGGDTREKQNEIAKRFPGLLDAYGIHASPPNDRRRLLDLSAVLSEETDFLAYHRLDRLNLSLKQPWGDLRMGRQALTWGNGLVFNPMDLFNPFSPTDIEREYKTGDDMISATVFAGALSEIQALCVPRREPDTGRLDAGQSAIGVKAHLIKKMTELDLLAAVNHDDRILGAGARGYLFDTAWRIDAVYTAVNAPHSADGFVSIVANLDYSWTWLARNWYGFIEFYFNGIGQDDYAAALADDDVRERLERGEMFVLGRWYAATHVRIELHPLVNAYVTAITNLEDPSSIVQPRLTWDATQNLIFTGGATLYLGGTGTEFGGFFIPETNRFQVPPDSMYLWCSYYF